METDIGTDPSTERLGSPRATRPGLALGLLALSHAVIHAQSALLPLIYPTVADQFHLDAGGIGLLIGISAAAGGLMQVTYGFLTRYVARPLLLAGGQVVFGLSLILASLSQTVVQFVAAISGARIGSSPQHPVGNALLSDVFPAERRGFAISAHISGGNVGTLLVPFAGLALVHAIGWQATLAVFGAPALVVGVLLALTVHEDHGAYRERARASGSFGSQLSQVLRRGDLRSILGASLVAAGGRGLDIVAPFMLLYLRGPLGISEGTTALLYALLLVGAIVGPVLAGVLSDRFGRRRTLVAYYALCAVGIIAFLAAGSNVALLAPLLLPFGTAVFSESPVLQAFLADRAVGPLRDMAFAVYFTAAFGVGAIWAVIIGQIVAAFGYPVAFSVMAASYLGAGALVASVREAPPLQAPPHTPRE
jgi:MFS family permease